MANVVFKDTLQGDFDAIATIIHFIFRLDSFRKRRRLSRFPRNFHYAGECSRARMSLDAKNLKQENHGAYTRRNASV